MPRGTRLGIILGLLVFSSACRKAPAKAETYAVFKTTKGTFKARLFADKTTKTVEHFTALASGKKKWRDPRDGKWSTKPLYDGVLFHRVIPGFMVQTGDPKGDGEGEIGVEIQDEIRPDLRFDRAGLLGMANHGPNTNGSQFFITLGPVPDLDGHHTLFGEVVEGIEVVKAMSKVPRDTAHEANRPLAPLVLESVTITDRR